MVCKDCQKKLTRLATSDTWRAGSTNSIAGKHRKLKENKLLTKPKSVSNEAASCRICKSRVHQQGSHYCQSCAYKKGICAMCGKKVLDTKGYRQSST